MRFTFVLMLVIFSGTRVQAQKDTADKIFAFKITSYINRLTDSSVIVQVQKPATVPVIIKEKQLATLFHNYSTGKTFDTAMIGWGRCQLIKSDFYYFGLLLKKGQQASGGDLLYLKAKLPLVYDGLLFKVMRHAVSFTTVFGDDFMNSNALFTNTQKDELRLLDSMVNDIQFTGKAMQEQMPGQNQLIAEGAFKGKKVFDAMQAAKRTDLEQFLKYMIARPKIYAGNNWKVSEIFATWMAEGAPAAEEN